jgi:hypothetical protein
MVAGMHKSGEFTPCLCWVLAMLPSPGFPYMAPERASRRRHPLMTTASMASAARPQGASAVQWSWCRIVVLAREGHRHSKQVVAPMLLHAIAHRSPTLSGNSDRLLVCLLGFGTVPLVHKAGDLALTSFVP